MNQYKKEIINGVAWTAAARYSGIIVGILVTMVLARILCPEDFGVVAISTVLIHFLAMFSSMGLGPAIIQAKKLEQEDVDCIFSFTVYVGIILTLLFIGAAWPIAMFYNNNVLTPICQLLSVNLFFSAINMVPTALMNKYKRFKEVAIRTLALQIITGIFSIIAAFYGAGLYSLLISPILTSIGIFIFNIRYYPVHFKLYFSFQPIKHIASYSVYQFLFELSNYFLRNFDKLIIGKYISATGLGLYEKSYRLMQMPLQNVTGVIHPVLQPVLATLQDDPDEMEKKYGKVISFVAMIGFPVAVILYYNAEEIITIMFGLQWGAAVPVFKIMALSIPTQMVLSTTGAIFQALNAPKTLFWCGFGTSLITIISFIIGCSFFGTIEAVAWGWTISSIISFFISFSVMYGLLFRIKLHRLFEYLASPFLNLIILVCVYEIYIHYCIIEKTPFANLIIGITLGMLVTLFYLQITGRINIKNYIKKNLIK